MRRRDVIQNFCQSVFFRKKLIHEDEREWAKRNKKKAKQAKSLKINQVVRAEFVILEPQPDWRSWLIVFKKCFSKNATVAVMSSAKQLKNSRRSGGDLWRARFWAFAVMLFGHFTAKKAFFRLTEAKGRAVLEVLRPLRSAIIAKPPTSLLIMRPSRPNSLIHVRGLCRVISWHFSSRFSDGREELALN